MALLNGPFQPGHAKRGAMRNGAAVRFWPCEEVAGFVFEGYEEGDGERWPHLWREDGTWRLADGAISQYDLMVVRSP